MFLGFYAVNFLCFGGNRVNIQGVSTDKATRKSIHNFRRNSQFSFLASITLMYVYNLMIFSQGQEKEKSYPCANFEKNLPSGTRPICVFRSLKTLVFRDVIKIEILQVTVLRMLSFRFLRTSHVLVQIVEK